MAELADLHQLALKSYYAGLKAVDPFAAIQRALEIDGNHLRVVDTLLSLPEINGNIYVVGLGKASLLMASALDEILGERLTAGVVSSYFPPEPDAKLHQLNPKRWEVFAGGHPTPNELSLQAAERAFSVLDRANRHKGLVIFLVSGGGSSMMELPRQGITLEELRAAYQTLVSCGAHIDEINSVRRTLSSVKGGGLARYAPDADHISLIISDTASGHETAVASGPTFQSHATSPDAGEVVSRYKLDASLPKSVMQAIDFPAKSDQISRQERIREHYVLLDNQVALQASAEAARLNGLATTLADDLADQPIDEGCASLFSRLARLRETTSSSPCCIISGGEFACPVNGDGVGGRNSETALRLALEMNSAVRELPSTPYVPHYVALSAGTDGIDGNSPATGALADETTVERGRARGLDAATYLESSDSYTFFNALGDAIVTGPTGTNVRDIRILIAA